jgi:hypothetical protein
MSNNNPEGANQSPINFNPPIDVENAEEEEEVEEEYDEEEGEEEQIDSEVHEQN